MNIDIDVDDFLEGCSSYEINEVVEWLEANEYIKNAITDNNIDNLQDIEFKEALSIIANNRIMLSVEEEELIKSIAKRF